MSTHKTVQMCGKPVELRASALIPRLYRVKFGRDMVRDMNQLRKAFDKAVSVSPDATEEEKQDAQLSVLDLTLFEDVAYIMAKHADKSIPDSPEEWLDSYEGVFSIYEILPDILELWNINQKTTSIPKKK